VIGTGLFFFLFDKVSTPNCLFQLKKLAIAMRVLFLLSLLWVVQFSLEEGTCYKYILAQKTNYTKKYN
jgi:hypothetical protein